MDTKNKNRKAENKKAEKTEKNKLESEFAAGFPGWDWDSAAEAGFFYVDPCVQFCFMFK